MLLSSTPFLYTASDESPKAKIAILPVTSFNCPTAATAKLLQSYPTVRPHRRKPTRLPCPRDSPGKNTGVGCHFLLQCVKVKSQSEVAQSCLTLSNPMDCSLPVSSTHGIFQARVLEWGAIAFSDIFSTSQVVATFLGNPAPLPQVPGGRCER